jgi:uncharacterized membrane protein YhaH (DUF805 family)
MSSGASAVVPSPTATHLPPTIPSTSMSAVLIGRCPNYVCRLKQFIAVVIVITIVLTVISDYSVGVKRGRDMSSGASAAVPSPTATHLPPTIPSTSMSAVLIGRCPNYVCRLKQFIAVVIVVIVVSAIPDYSGDFKRARLNHSAMSTGTKDVANYTSSHAELPTARRGNIMKVSTCLRQGTRYTVNKSNCNFST